jgi:hypothetical protein
MKKTFFSTSCLLVGLFFLNSCESSDIVSASKTSPSSERVAAVGPWTRQFTEDFSAGSKITDRWTAANRKDYNSNYCQYDPAVPVLATNDFRQCLVISATKTGTDAYKSGLLKTKTYTFKPARNEEFRVSSQIKLIAKDGSTFKSFKQTYGAWPAFWTVQETNWPTKGEIDIMEGYSFNPSAARFASNLFYGTTTGSNLLGNTAERNYPSSFDVDGNSGWHLYDCFWKNQNGVVTVTIKIDNATVATYTDSINGNLRLANFGPHNVMLNLNVGSNDNSFINKSLINILSSTQMWVDYVTVDKRTI